MDDWVKTFIRTIPDFPKEGIQFRDVTTLLSDPHGFKRAIDELVLNISGMGIQKVVGIEARGFILGGALAHQLGAGFVPIRKPGKLPFRTFKKDYKLEYGTDSLEIHKDALNPGDKCLLVDDLIATGGTALAGIQLIIEAGGEVAGASFLVDLVDLGGAQKIRDCGLKVFSLTAYEGA